MANRERGQVTFEVEGQVYTLHMTMDAMCAAESVLSTSERDVSFLEIQQRALKGSMTAVRAIFWGALRSHHPGITVAQAGELILALGGAGDQLSRLMSAASPETADVEAMGGNPPRARTVRRRGTGATSI